MAEPRGIDSWFLHLDLVLKLLPPGFGDELRRRLPHHTDPLYPAMMREVVDSALGHWLAETDVASLEVAHLKGVLTTGDLVWYEGALAFKGVTEARASLEGGPERRATFTARLPSNQSVRVAASYSARHLTSNTSTEQLRGTRRQFVLGYVEDATDATITLRPILIAQRWSAQRATVGGQTLAAAARVYPGQVDQFADVDFTSRLRKSDLDVLKQVPEERVKEAFAAIIGEPDVPKDWGGEQFDLWSHSRLSLGGVQLSAAIAFKGPAAFHPMVIADLGKNGDQIDRLAQTAADLLVVQHCHSITAPVVNMLTAYACDSRRPRRFMILDGYDTIRLLRHHKFL